MFGINRLAGLAAILVLTGAGCFSKKTTPFVLPQVSPPKPLFSAAPAEPGREPVLVKIYLIAPEGSEALEAAKGNAGSVKIGCGDYAVPVLTTERGDPEEPESNALSRLLALKSEEAASLGGYRTMFGQGKLKIREVKKLSDGSIAVDLVGEISSAGVCDDPRIKAQLTLTAGVFGQVKILLNGSESAWRCFGDQSGLCK